MLTVLIVIVLAIAAVVFLASRRPDDFEIVRTATLAAAPARIFAEVNTLRRWEAWSPWAKLDPGAKTEYSGPASGVGASMSWAGRKSGAGTSTVIESEPDRRVKLHLEFRKPMKATNIALFTFQPQGEATLVSWSMSGRTTLMTKTVGMVMNCEAMVGRQFEEGLASLKEIVEG